MKLGNSIINKVCDTTNFKYDDNYFKFDLFNDCDIEIVNYQIKSKINDISEDDVGCATVFIGGFP